MIFGTDLVKRAIRLEVGFTVQFTYDRAAVACGIPLDHWDKMSAEHQGRTIAVWESERTMRDWISYLSEQKAERERKAQSGK